MRVLVVDDDPVFREAFTDHLEHAGHSVVAEPSATKALERTEAEEFDLVFTDLKMPRQSGLDLLKMLKQRSPRTLVVLVTGFATVPTAVEAMKSGAFDYLTKPFRTQQVDQVLHLAEAERSYTDSILREREVGSVVSSLARGGRRVLVLGPFDGPRPRGVEVVPLDGSDLASVHDAVSAFLAEPGPVAVVVPRVDQWLSRHRLEDVVHVLRVAREALKGRGPLAVGMDSRRVSQDRVPALLEVVASDTVHGTLEALGNPIRRATLARLAEGPARFADVMRASGLEDSPKLSFHLHRLTEEGLVRHDDEVYRLTPKGEEAVALLHALQAEVASSSDAGFFFRGR